jgi:hypothetical protein
MWYKTCNKTCNKTCKKCNKSFSRTWSHRKMPSTASKSTFNQIEKRLVLIMLVIVFTHQIKIQKRHVRIHSPPNVIRACIFTVLSGSYTTSTTNMYKTSRTPNAARSNKCCAAFPPILEVMNLRINKIGKNVSLDHTLVLVFTHQLKIKKYMFV